MYIVHLYKSAHINIHINIHIFFPPWHFNFSVLLLWLPPHHKCVSNSNVKDQVFCSVLLFQRLDVQARGINLSSLRRSFQWPAIKLDFITAGPHNPLNTNSLKPMKCTVGREADQVIQNWNHLRFQFQSTNPFRCNLSLKINLKTF